MRVTAISNLKRKNYSNKQVIAISGHKREASVEGYHRVSDKEKLLMGTDLAQALIVPPKPLAIQKAPQMLALPAPETSNQMATNFLTINLNQLAQILALQNNQSNQILPLDGNIQQEDEMPETGLSDADLVQIIQQCEKENEDVMMSQQCQKEVTNSDGSCSKILTKQMVA